MAETRHTATTLMALMAAGNSQALNTPEHNEVQYRVSQYQQQKYPENRVSSGSIDTYQIEIHQLGLRQKLAEQWLFSLNASQESMSGASVLQTFENASGQSQMIVSGASISEQRRDIAINGERYFPRGKAGLGYYQSNENDYTSQGVNVSGLFEFNSALSTIGFSFAQSNDELHPTDPQLGVNRQLASGEQKSQQEWYLSASQVLNKYEVIQLSYGQRRLNGYLSDPYRNIDRRPEQRSARIASFNYRFYVKPLAGAIHSDYRFYQDDWQVTSHTISFGWHQDLSRWFRWRFITRLYRQQQAEFYSLAGTDSGDLQSNDARLSSYGALAATIGADITVRNWRLSADWQQYQSRESWGPGGNNNPEAPGLVHYQMLSFGLLYRY